MGAPAKKSKRIEPIRINDKLSDGKHIWKVIETIPGGKLHLFDRERCYFQTRYHREIKEWTRVKDFGE